MKILISIILLLGSYNIAECKELSGVYYLKGIAYFNKSMPIRNKVIELEYGQFKNKIRTNNKGEFSVKVNWKIPCMSVNFGGFTKEDEEIEIANANPKYLVFQFKNKCIYIENYFYTNPQLTSVPFLKPLTFYEDLNF